MLGLHSNQDEMSPFSAPKLAKFEEGAEENEKKERYCLS
jgi:hypothetical protein